MLSGGDLVGCLGGALADSPQLPENTGAGEGIRTLDPNLGKVVLYP